MKDTTFPSAKAKDAVAANASDLTSRLNGSSMASLSGARTKVEEKVTFPVAALDSALAQIRKLGATGELSISFANGTAAGQAVWRQTGVGSTRQSQKP